MKTNKDCDLEKTIRQVEQKFATDLKIIAGDNQRRGISKNIGGTKKLWNRYQKNAKNIQNTYQRDSGFF